MYKVNFRLLMLMSMYFSAGLQDKKLSDIKYLVFNKMNVERKGAARFWKPSLVSSDRYKYIFLVRNPLRLALSAASWTRNHWTDPGRAYSPEQFRSIIDQAAAMLGMYAETREVNPDGARLVVHERLSRDHEVELKSIFRFINPDLEAVADSNTARGFFKRMPCCKTEPVERGGRLTCPSCGTVLKGHGMFNPITPVSLDRTMSGRIDGAFSEDGILYFKDAFGAELAAYWLEDADHLYEDDIPHAAVEALKAKGGWARVVATA